MKNIDTTAIRYQDGKLWVLDQQQLPKEQIWVESKTPEDMCHIIQALKVRGAPLIGVAAALALAHLAEQGASIADIKVASKLLRNARPTAVNLMCCVDRVMSALDKNQSNTSIVSEIALQILEEDIQLCQKMATHGTPLIQSGEGVLTYCNSGSLATAGVGTALGVIKEAYRLGKQIHVYPCETRPLLQGARLSAWELKQAKVPHTLICDNMAGYLMAQGKIQKIFVGADRIAANGDFANKIGTYTVAVLAKHHNIPFYVVAPYTTVDLQCDSGKNIVVEQRAAEEVRGASGSFGSVDWSPKDVATYNPSFDVTPSHLVTGFVLDAGLLQHPNINKVEFSKLINQ